jgi:hypothetical protein
MSNIPNLEAILQLPPHDYQYMRKKLLLIFEAHGGSDSGLHKYIAQCHRILSEHLGRSSEAVQYSVVWLSFPQESRPYTLANFDSRLGASKFSLLTNWA